MDIVKKENNAVSAVETKKENNVEVKNMEINKSQDNLGEKLQEMVENNKHNFSFGNVNRQPYGPLPEDPKERALVFLGIGLKRLFDTLEINQRAPWTEKEDTILYGSGGIMEKTIEIEELVSSLKQETEISTINQKLKNNPVHWIELTPVENGKFKLINKNTGEIISIDNAEVTKKLIDTLSKMSF